MKKVMLVFGTRPEAIKMCPLVKEFQKDAENFKTIVCVTGQHREMLDQVLTIFDVKPDYDLNIMKQGQDLYDVTARVILGMRDVLKEAQPDVVLCMATQQRRLRLLSLRSINRFLSGTWKRDCAPTTSIRRGLKR